MITNHNSQSPVEKAMITKFISKEKKTFIFINPPHSLVDDDSNSVFSYIENSTSLAMVKLVWHALLNSSMTLQ